MLPAVAWAVLFQPRLRAGNLYSPLKDRSLPEEAAERGKAERRGFQGAVGPVARGRGGAEAPSLLKPAKSVGGEAGAKPPPPVHFVG